MSFSSIIRKKWGIVYSCWELKSINHTNVKVDANIHIALGIDSTTRKNVILIPHIIVPYMYIDGLTRGTEKVRDENGKTTLTAPIDGPSGHSHLRRRANTSCCSPSIIYLSAHGGGNQNGSSARHLALVTACTTTYYEPKKKWNKWK